MATGGISGTGVAMVAAGSFLVYIGLRDITPLEGLRELGKGKLPKGTPKEASGATKSAVQALWTGGGSGSATPAAGGQGAAGGDGWGALVAAAQTFSGDKYSQANRWADGYSDCSSFAGKSLKKVGVTPPGASVTTSYLTWSALQKVSRSEVRAGDFLVNTGHMVIAISNTDAIGQQNGRSNVQVGKIETLMSGLGFTCLRYTPTTRSADSMRT